MSSPLRIPIILGTGRTDRRSEAVANHVLTRAQAIGWNTELVDVRDFGTERTIAPEEDSALSQRWKDIVAAADGLIIVSPEYNHGYPGELKNLLDMAYHEYTRKAAGLAVVSTGSMGGCRVAEQLTQVLHTFQLTVSKRTLYVSNVKDTFPDGVLAAGMAERFSGFTDGLLADVAWHAEALRTARAATNTTD